MFETSSPDPYGFYKDLPYSTRIKKADRLKITSTKDAFALFWEVWDNDTIEHIEEVKLLLLNRANYVLGFVNLSKGGVSGSVIYVKVVLQYAIKSNSKSVIMAHNHPSGNLLPGENDKNITKIIKQG